MRELTEKLLSWLPMTAATVHDHGPAAPALRERYLRRHPGAAYWIGDGPSPTDGLLRGQLDVLVLRLGACDDLVALAEQLLLQRIWLSATGVILLVVPDQGALFTIQQRLDLAQAGLHLTKQGVVSGWRVLVMMAAPPRPLQIRAIPLREQAGMVDVRIRQPMQALSTLPDVHTEVMRLPVTGRQMKKPSSAPTVLLWQRPILDPERDSTLVQQIKQYGFKLVVDFDDHPMRWPSIEESGYYTFKASDGVVTSTRILDRFFSSFCSSVFVRQNTCFELPNTQEGLPVPADNLSPPQILFASLNRLEDAIDFLPAFNRFLDRCPHAFRFHVVGDRSFFDQLSSSYKTFEPFLSYSDYLLRLAHADLVFCPLADEFFNRHKSSLKFVEAATYRKPLLASKVVYSEVIWHGVNGLIVEPSSLEQCMESLARDPGIIGRLGLQAYQDLQATLMTHHSLHAIALWLKGLF